MNGSVALWELEVSFRPSPGGAFWISGILWHAPIYPARSESARAGRSRGRITVAEFPPEEARDPVTAVRALWDRASPSMSPVDGAFLRLTLDLPRELESLEWEQTAPALVVRRPSWMRPRFPPNPVTLRLPLSVRLVDPTGTTAAEIYRDQHLAAVRDVGLEIVEAGPDVNTAILQVMAAGEADVAALADRLANQLVKPLLVIVQISGRPPAGLEGLSSRAGALLAVDLTPESLRAFYRALLQDLPIDRSLARALAVTEPRWYRLWAGGDERLPLLSTAVLEAASATFPTPLFGKTRGSVPDRLEPPAGGRRDAIRKDLRSRVEAMRTPLEAAISETLQSIREGTIDFSAEDHGVREVANVQRQLETAADLASARAALSGPAGPLQEAVARVTSLWLRRPDGQDLARDQPLVEGRPYQLALKIGGRHSQARSEATFPEKLLARTFRYHDTVELDVVVFSPPEDFQFTASCRAKLRLPRFGDSEAIVLPLLARRSGNCRLRACVYHGTRLLQSVWLAAWIEAVEGEAGDPIRPGSQVGLDYAATADFALLEMLESLPAPEASIVINEAAGGSHWVGVYAPGDRTALTGLNVRLFTISDRDLRATVESLQEALQTVAFYGQKYRFADDAFTEDQWRLHERALIGLARAGRRMCRTLLGHEFKSVLGKAADPGVLSIGRCSGDGVGVPWASCYDAGLNLALPASEQSVCPVFSAQARAGQTLLDDPVACRAQPACPLNVEGADQRVVCPFGFWGIRHQIEQPLHHLPVVRPTSAVEARIGPSESVIHGADEPGARLLVACGRYEFADADNHPAELAPAVNVSVESDRDKIVKIVKTSGASVIYFFCHGKVVEGELMLQVGPATAAEYIGPDSLGDRFEWKERQPLVFLNGCDTVAFSAEAINNLTTMFRACGAAGVIGTEFSVPRPLARTVGAEILRQLAAGQTVGRAFLNVRRLLLRRMNPLGLAYSTYSSAWLHYAQTAVCPQCQRTARPAG